jgi:DUF4097 and DUF4098 domain-containing protein YvlB
VTPFIARIAFLLTPFVALVPSAAAAQDPGAPPRVIARIAPERIAWFERYQEARKGAEANQTIVRTFKVAPGTSLDVFNMAGDVTVTGVSGDQIAVTAVKQVWGGDGKAQLENIGVDFNETSGRLEVRTSLGRARNSQAEVSFTIDVPFDTPVFVRTISGDVTVAKVRGDLQVESTSGTVEATGTPRVLRLKTISGDVRITDASAPDVLSASTVSGSVEARGLKARGLEVVSVSGDLVLFNTACDRAQLRTVNGNVQYVGSMSKGGRYEISSHSGDVRFELVGNGGFELSARTFNGEVNSELPLVMGKQPDEGDIPGMPKNHDIRGTYGDGSALLIVKTFSGDVTVGRAEADNGKDRKDKRKD